MTSSTRPFFSYALWFSLMLVVVNCGPASNQEAPPLLEVSPLSLEFQASQDSLFLEIGNTGGGSLTYTIKLGAESGGVEWLKVSSPTGAVEGGASRSILVSVADRGSLQPDIYSGQITVEAEGLAAQIIPVTMVVGQPILVVEPLAGIDFGDSANTQTLTVRNVGDGPLIYTVLMPEEWLQTTDPTQMSLAPSAASSLQLQLLRQAVPWYGAGAGEITIKSNGASDGTHAGTITLPVAVTTDDACTVDGTCLLPGYFCQGATKTCQLLKNLADTCTGTKECKSGFCVEGVCCDAACQGQCLTCKSDVDPGFCQPRPDGTPCTDDQVCTAEDFCQTGACQPGPPLDCQEWSTPCVDGLCDEAKGGCFTPEVTGKCIIDDVCYQGAESHPEISCLSCIPEASADQWTLDAGTCLIDGQCWVAGVSSEARECMVCNPLAATEAWSLAPGWCLIDDLCLKEGSPHPDEPCLACVAAVETSGWSPLPGGTSCDDLDACTLGDACQDGLCAGSPMPCDDGRECTLDSCLDGACTFDLQPGYCLITESCVAEGTVPPGAQCLACLPETNPGDWSPANPGEACETGLYCTIDGHCQEGVCQGVPRDCGADQCHNAWCIEVDEECAVAPKTDGSPCDDADPCTVLDECLSGICGGAMKDCAAEVELGPCSVAGCDPASVPEPGACFAKLVDAGTVCDDGLACTEATVCDAGGVCGAGQLMGAAECGAALEQTGQCVVAWCEEPAGCLSEHLVDGAGCLLPNAVAQCDEGTCVLVECAPGTFDNCDGNADNGCETDLAIDLAHCGACDKPCLLPNAFPSCAAGECTLVKCKDGYKNCDDDLVTGCEAHTDVDPTHCGYCGTVCTSANPAKVGVCEAGICGLKSCVAGHWNLDGDPGNGCECQTGGEELCNGIDDDCDGDVDEGFDLLTDLANCGGCGEICAGVDGASSLCVLGVCLVTECPPGWVDANGLAADGCEWQPFVTDELWVDAFNVGDPAADGSQAHPYDTIQKAVAAAYPSALIHVGEGVYSGALEVNQVGLTIVGAGQELVTVSVGADETAIRVTASDVTITDLSTTGGVVGILFAGTPQLPLAGGRVARVTVKNMASTSGIQVDSAGISAHYVDDFSLSQFGIALMEGNNDLMGGAYGVDLVYADDAVIAGGTIDSIIGGHADSIWETPGGRGGPGYGVKIASSKGVLLRGLTVNQVTGGEGSFVHSQIGQYAGVGGLAAAVHLAGSSGTTIDALEAASLTGGAGGNGFSYTPGVAQRAYGIYLSADSLDTTVDVNCRYEGEPILYFNGLLDATIAGFVVVKDVFPTNLGKLVVVNSTNVLIADNKVANLVGETGEQTTATGQIGKPGGDVAGILLHNCNGCRVIANVAHDIAGGKGGNGALCGDGGVGAGIWVRASEDVELAGNHTWSIQGGDDGDPHTHGAGGVGYGYLLESSSQLAFHNNLAYGIDSGTGRVACDYPAACVGIDDCEPMLLSHLTCWNIGPQNCGGGDGVRLLGNQDESVHVVNSILSQVNGYCLSTEAPAGGPLGSAYCLLDGCQDGLATGNAASSGSNLLFHNAAGGSLRLQPGSPGIDAGKASSDCSLEPFPNGCRVNIGAFGNTLDATANDGADHCDVCPGQ